MSFILSKGSKVELMNLAYLNFKSHQIVTFFMNCTF